MFPKFSINKVFKIEEKVELVGTVSSDSFKNEKWIEDKWLGFLRKNNLFIYGRWHKQDENWKFVIKPEDTLGINFFEGEELDAIDGYWGERVELIFDENICWKEANYKAQNDHNHCFFCWATISEVENKKYMLANERIGVCMSCYENYVIPKNLDFIVVPKK